MKKLKPWQILGLFFVAFIVIALIFGEDKSPNKPLSEVAITERLDMLKKVYSENSISIESQIKSEVKNQLKSPSTADFQNIRAEIINDTIGEIGFAGSVDAQNSFGAMIRTYYVGSLIIKNTHGEFEITSVKLLE